MGGLLLLLSLFQQMLIVMTRNKSTSPNKPFEKVKYRLLGTISIQQKDKKIRLGHRPVKKVKNKTKTEIYAKQISKL